MHEARLMDLLAEVLSIHGYRCTRQAALEGRSGTVYTVPLLAESDGALIVDAQMGDDVVPLAALADMDDVLHDVAADHGVLCHHGAIESGARPDGIVLWGRDDLARIVGEAKVAHASGREPEPLRLDPRRPPTGEPLAESVHDLLPDAFQEPSQPSPEDDLLGAMAAVGAAEAAKEPTETISPFDLAAMETMDAPAPREEAPPEVSGYAYPVLPVRVTPDEARLRLRGRMDRVDAVQMVLQPVHLLDYECDLLAEGSLRYDTIEGRIQVHGTDKSTAEVDREAVDPQGFTRLPELPAMPGHERTLRTSEERAKERATTFLMEAHTRMVDVEVDDPDLGFAYTEKKKVAPRPDHVRLAPLGVFHRVVWRFTSPAGQIDVDSLTGHIVEEALVRPDSDSLVID